MIFIWLYLKNWLITLTLFEELIDYFDFIWRTEWLLWLYLKNHKPQMPSSAWRMSGYRVLASHSVWPRFSSPLRQATLSSCWRRCTARSEQCRPRWAAGCSPTTGSPPSGPWGWPATWWSSSCSRSSSLTERQAGGGGGITRAADSLTRLQSDFIIIILISNVRFAVCSSRFGLFKPILTHSNLQGHFWSPN